MAQPTQTLLPNNHATQISWQLKLCALFLAIQHTQTLTHDVHIFTDSLDSIYLLSNHLRDPSSRHNYPNKLLTVISNKHNIISQYKKSMHMIISPEMMRQTNLPNKDPFANPIPYLLLPFHLIGYHIPYQPPVFPTSTQHNSTIHNLKWYVEKEYFNSTISYTTNNIPYINKWLQNTTIHHPWSNIL